ncbi:MAG: UDP-N-acetylmuramate dehydrogenase [Candidatus Saccharibacteria bacterium]
MKITENISLKNYTTFGIGGPARYFIEAKDAAELAEAFEYAKKQDLPVLVLGGGSNILVSDKGFPGVVLKIANEGVTVVEDNAGAVQVKAAAGENWDKFAAFCASNGWWGVENLSGIPGSVGGMVVQDAGAYGQEIRGALSEVTVFDRRTGELRKLSAAECGFGYRTSIFNGEQKDRYAVWEAVFALNKNGRANLKYKDLKNFFGETEPPVSMVRQAVLDIRRNKFPDPKVSGSAGSFFKNLVLSLNDFQRLKARLWADFPEGRARLSEYEQRAAQGSVKVPTAFLLDILGMKRERNGQAAINDAQPQIILNLGGAGARDVLGLYKAARQKIYLTAGMIVEPEPEFVGFTEEELREYSALPEKRALTAD